MSEHHVNRSNNIFIGARSDKKSLRMKKMNRAILAVLLVSQLGVASAECFYNDYGSVTAGNGTKYIARIQDNKTWQDWIWRGSWEGERAYCPTNAAGNCNFNWGRSKTQGTSTTKGFNLQASGDIGRANNNFAHANATAGFNASWTKYYETTQSFEISVSFSRGKYIEPIIVQNRRWKQGNMQGGFIFTNYNYGNARWPATWCYRYDGGRQFGKWSANHAEGGAYRSFHIY